MKVSNSSINLNVDIVWLPDDIKFIYLTFKAHGVTWAEWLTTDTYDSRDPPPYLKIPLFS